MEENKKEKTKMTYEQLEAYTSQLSNQANQMYKQLQEANLYNMFERLKFLFKVVKYKESFSSEFVKRSISEIEDMMTIPDIEENKGE